ncbi:hypothetical protein Dip510_000833 [Elusimicrobium posterum]|uniref:hypothetical protein n=1 Tax=Elusimicrobium posterum TaxID=3116653 RepID=UPI003C75F3E7
MAEENNQNLEEQNPAAPAAAAAQPAGEKGQEQNNAAAGQDGTNPSTPGDKKNDGAGQDGTNGETPAQPDNKTGEKTDGEEDAANKPEDKKTEGAPETYKDFDMPQGYSIDKEIGAEFAAQAKADNLPQDVAQKYIDLGIKAQQKTNEVYKNITDGWEKETNKILGADSEGKLTQEGEKRLAMIKQTALKAGGQEALDILDATCASKHKAIAQLLLNVAPYVLEDDMNIDGKTPTPTKSDGDLFYGKSNKNK